ncbi:hypothetical protein [Streptomyces altiplanensis]
MLVELADELAAHLTRMANEQGDDYADDTNIEPALAEVRDTPASGTVPPARQLTELLTKRGWTGWTKLERVGPARGAPGTGQQGVGVHRPSP